MRHWRRSEEPHGASTRDLLTSRAIAPVSSSSCLRAHQRFPLLREDIDVVVRAARVLSRYVFVDFKAPSRSGGDDVVPIDHVRNALRQFTAPRDIKVGE